MKIKQLYMAAAVFAAVSLAGCEDEKDLVIIDGNLPIKASALYMVGDATPNGWSIDSPTPFTATEADPLVFEWSGSLNAGEMKLCLVTGSWDAPFIRPLKDQSAIGTADIDGETFQMHSGDPDEKWRVTEAGSYTLTFDLRNWKMSTRYNGGAPEPEKDPISSETLYIVGDAVPSGWNIDDPTALVKTGDYTFEYEGELKTGEFKACLVPGSWDVDFIRPSSADVEINKDGVGADDFVFVKNPDNKWKVTYRANYKMIFDLEKYTLNVQYVSDVEDEDENPLLTATDVWMIGDATPNGWSLDDAQQFVKAEGKDHVFVWQGNLVGGTFKACIIRDFSAPFIRPASDGVTVSKAGVSAPEFVYTTSPDDQWRVTEAGEYRITLDLENNTIEAVYVENGGGDEPEEGIVTDNVWMIGEATAGGWSLDDATAYTKESKYIFTWQGHLKTGTFKACTVRNFDAPFIRPAGSGVTVSKAGVSAPEFVYTTSPDDQWQVTEAGEYKITLDLLNYTIKVEVPSDKPAPIETDVLYMIGDGTPGGWSLDDAQTFVKESDGVFSWTGDLKEGTFKACVIKDFGAPFLRPSSGNVTVSAAGVSAPDFVYTTSPDDQWRVTEPGRYKITFNLGEWTIATEKL